MKIWRAAEQPVLLLRARMVQQRSEPGLRSLANRV
jgi:hypothetical protein